MTRTIVSAYFFMNKKQILLLTTLIGIITLFFLFDFQQYLNLEHIKSQKILINNYFHNHPLFTGFLFFIFFVLVTSISLPGAGILTLTSGAIFGVFWGTVISSYATLAGATIAFLISRYILRDFIQRRFSQQIEPINQSVIEEGRFYLFSMRMIPVFPFL